MAQSNLTAIPAVAFNELTSKLLGSAKIPLQQFQQQVAPASSTPKNAPLFVTWNKRHRLRGCIGTFSEQPSLEQGIRVFSRSAAFEDPRFPPVSSSEISSLSVCVTLLSPMQSIVQEHDWTIGLHGIRASYASGKSSVFLPSVAEEQNWDRDDTLRALRKKAGARPSEAVKYYRFTGTKVEMSFEEYTNLIKEMHNDA